MQNIENSDNLFNCKNHKRMKQCCELTKPPKQRQKLTKFNDVVDERNCD